MQSVQIDATIERTYEYAWERVNWYVSNELSCKMTMKMNRHRKSIEKEYFKLW